MLQRAPMIFALFALAALVGLALNPLAFEALETAGTGESPLQATDAPPVVVELFTSQGCSSCPSADRLLSRLGREGIAGVRIIPLSYHVDYWNYIGWQDPFSQARWSRRQEEYAESLGKGRLYTPQAVVQGMEDCVGSRSNCLESAVSKAAKKEAAARLTAKPTIRPGGYLELEATVHSAPGSLKGLARKELEVVAVLFETNLSTPVRSGENARQTLENDYVVRSLDPMFRVSAQELSQGKERSGKVQLRLQPGWSRENLGVAVLLQESSSRHILAAWAQDV